jgi:hypothetical protein
VDRKMNSEQKFRQILEDFKKGILVDTFKDEPVEDRNRALEIAYSERGFLFEEPKVSKLKVGYINPSTIPNESCQECINFIKSSLTCKRVEGVIAKLGWCDLFNSFEFNTNLLKSQKNNPFIDNHDKNKNPFMDEETTEEEDKIKKSLENLLIRRDFKQQDTYYEPSNIKLPIEKSEKRMDLISISKLHNIPIKELYKEFKTGQEIEKSLSKEQNIVTEIVIENLIKNPTYYSNSMLDSGDI